MPNHFNLLIKVRMIEVNIMINIIKLEDLVKQIMFNNALKGHLSTSKSSFTVLKSDWALGKKGLS